MVTSAISRMGKSPEEGIKAPVKTSTTVNITLAGTGQTLNGVVTGTGDRVLVKDQTVPAENGTYLVGPDAWERTTDMNAADDLANGQLIVDSNTLVTYVITYTGAWTPDITALVFTVLLGSMPSMITLTNPSPIDLVDINVALITGADDPLTEPHLEYDFESIQSKATATAFAPLNLNPFGGIVNIGDMNGVGTDTETRIWHNSHRSWDFLEAITEVYSYQVWDKTVPDPMELTIDFYDVPGGFQWGSIGWNGADAFRIFAGGYDSDFILQVVNGVGATFDVLTMNTGSFQVNLDATGEQTMFDASSGATLALSAFQVYIPTTIDTFDLNMSGGNIVMSSGASKSLRFEDTGAFTDEGKWEFNLNGTEFKLRAANDAYGSFTNLLFAERGSAEAVGSFRVGSTGVDILILESSATGNINLNPGTGNLNIGGVLGDYNSIAPTDDEILIASSGVFITADLPTLIAATPPAAHTHVAANITDFDTEVSNNASVTANTAKVTNVPTALSIGTHAIGTLAITSDGGADDVVLPSFTATLSGLSPGSGGGTANFLRADGTWAVPPGAGGITVTGTPVNNQLAVWTSASDLEGDANLTWSGSELNVAAGDISVDATRVVYFDGSGNTYITESSDGVLSFVTNGFTRFNCSTATFQTNVEQILFGDQGPADVLVTLNAAAAEDSSIRFNEGGSIAARFFRDQSADEFWLENSAVRVWTANTAGELVMPAATTARTSINIPHGAAPTTPNDGDMWTTTAGLFIRINGSTVGPLS